MRSGRRDGGSAGDSAVPDVVWCGGRLRADDFAAAATGGVGFSGDDGAATEAMVIVSAGFLVDAGGIWASAAQTLGAIAGLVICLAALLVGGGHASNIRARAGSSSVNSVDCLPLLMAEVIFARLDATGFNKLVEAARVFNKRTPAVAANVAGLYVARQARYETHKISVPPGRMDAELAVEVTPRISARTGKPVSRRTKNPNNVRALAGPPSYKPAIPFTWLIIGARAKPFSNYNQRTGQRYALAQHPFKGQRRSQFGKIMAAYVKRMVSSRHSSSGFLQSGWIACIIEGEQYVPGKYRRGGTSGPPPLDGKRAAPGLGGFIPAVEGENAQCSIENKVGMLGGNSVLMQRRNAALWEAGEPALNHAIAIQAEITLRYIVEQEARAQFGPLKAAGVLVEV
jgi:hypothetical protein